MTDEASVVERVARAMCHTEAAKTGVAWKGYLPQARAALEAMKEPTLDMIAAGQEEMVAWQPPEPVWTAMIEAALKEKSSG